MKRILMAIAVLAVTVVPAFAADVADPDMNRPMPGMMGTDPDMKTMPERAMPEMKGTVPDMKAMPDTRGSAPGGAADTMKGMPQHHGMKKEMMRNPQHLLMMAHHKNVLTFGHMLEKMARQGETVPRDFARAAIAEMRRSTEEMERYRAGAMRDMPAEMKDQGDMKKKMDQHLVNVKTHLRQLEDLASKDRIPSQEVLKHLEPIFEGCEGMGCGKMDGKGRHGGMMHHDEGMRHDHEGMHHDKMMHGKDGHGCQCEKCEDTEDEED